MSRVALAIVVLGLVAGCKPRPGSTDAPPFTRTWCDGADPGGIRPPPHDWWKSKTPCPHGTELALGPEPAARLDLAIPATPMKGVLHCVRPDGTAHGPTTAFYASGRSERSGCFANGVLHGTWEQFDTDGALLQTSTFAGGLPTGTWERYHGIRVSERRVFESPIAAEVSSFDAQGGLLRSGRVVDGLREGAWTITANVEQFREGRRDEHRPLFGVASCDAWLAATLHCVRGRAIDEVRVQAGRALELVTATVYEAQDVGGTATCDPVHAGVAEHLARLGCAPPPAESPGTD